VDGTALAVASPCAKQVTIEPAATLSGKVEVTATAERQAEIDQLDIAGGATASIGVRGRDCNGAGWRLSFGLFRSGIENGPTLMIAVKVPAGMAIDIKETRSTDYQVGAVGGTLRLDLSGSGDVSAEEAKDLVAKLSGSGDARLERVQGSLEARLSGSGNLSVGRADVSDAALTLSGSGNASVEEGDFSQVAARLSGSGDLSLGDGKIGTLTLVSSGSADAGIDARVTDADLSVTGSSDVRIREVTGRIKQSRHGSGSIEIGR
jgi:hypothetical protein